MDAAEAYNIVPERCGKEVIFAREGVKSLLISIRSPAIALAASKVAANEVDIPKPPKAASQNKPGASGSSPQIGS